LAAGDDAGLVLRYAFDEPGGALLVDSGPQGLDGSVRRATEALPDVIEGRIATPGQAVVYSFDLGDTRQFVFDALRNLPFSWSLSGPRGTLVDGRSFQSSDGRDLAGFDGYSGDPARSDRVVHALGPGRYTLRVSAPGDSTGDFAFRLIDLATATPVATGTRVDDSLAVGGQTRAYAFDLQAGDRLVFDALAATDTDLRWRLISPTGEQLWVGSFSDVAERTYNQTGRYTLLVEGWRGSWRPNAVAFQLLPRGNTLAERVAGFDQDFDGPALDPMWLVGPAGNRNLENPVPYRFETLDGASVLRLQGPMPYASNRAGGFTQVGNALGQGFSYEVRFNTLVQSAATAFDELIGLGIIDVDDPDRHVYVDLFSDGNGANRQFRSGSAGVGGAGFAQQAFAFADNTWYRIKLEAAAAGNIRAVVLSDAGQELISRDLGITADAFARGGRFGFFQNNTIGGTTPRDVAIDWARLSTTPATPAALPLGALLAGSRASAAQRDLYSFTLTQTTRVLMDPRADNGSLFWTLLGDRGQIGRQSFQTRGTDASANPVMTLDAGSYTLRIDGNTTGDYGFRLLDLDSATPLQPGAPQTITLNPGNSTELRRFQGTAGDRFYLDSIASSLGDTGWRLISPSGDQRWMFNASSDVPGVTLDQTGTWTLVVEGRRTKGATTGTLQFNLVPVADTTTEVMLGSGAGVQLRWVAGAPALGGSALAFDALRDVVIDDAITDRRADLTIEAWIRPERASNTWMPIAIRGNEAGQRSYGLWLHSSGYLYLGTRDASNEQVVQSATGSVRFGQWTHVAGVIDRSGATPQLRLYIDGVLAGQAPLRATPAVGVAEGLRIGSTLERDSNYGRFDGAIDELRLWNVARSAAQIDAGRNSALAGTPAGVVLRLGFDEGSGGSVADSGPLGRALPVGHLFGSTAGALAGTLVTPGQIDRYRFTLTQPTRIAFDTLLDAYNVVGWTLDGPQGRIDARILWFSDSSDRFPVYLLPAGTYTLSLSASGDNTGAYALRLLDLAGALPITPGTPVAGELQPGSQTDLFAFDGSAGQAFYFDTLASASGDGRLRLLGPQGQLVWEMGLGSDVDVFTLPADGRYTLLVEGRRSAALQRNAYRFNLVPVATGVTNVTLDQQVGLAPVFAAGRLGQALVLDGLRSVQLPDDAATNQRDSLTVEAWINPTRFADTWMPIVTKDATGSQRSYSLWLNANGSVYADSRDASGVQPVQSAGGLVRLGEWTHVALVVDRTLGASRLRLYINGVEAPAGGAPLRLEESIYFGGLASQRRTVQIVVPAAQPGTALHWKLARRARRGS
ncbi:MAG: LamG domain-containing protein, partial [Burkholderiales bacterium]|nr:LamG domain-containing protein [Burkholderiales bacterium]